MIKEEQITERADTLMYRKPQEQYSTLHTSITQIYCLLYIIRTKNTLMNINPEH